MARVQPTPLYWLVTCQNTDPSPVTIFFSPTESSKNKAKSKAGGMESRKTARVQDTAAVGASPVVSGSVGSK